MLSIVVIGQEGWGFKVNHPSPLAWRIGIVCLVPVSLVLAFGVLSSKDKSERAFAPSRSSLQEGR